jgi:alpha-beta hydrolase superfamily lysophospholipase
MPNPSDLFAGRSTVEFVSSRGGVEQLRRTWEADDPHASVLILHGIAEHSGRYEHIGSTWAEAGFTARAIDHHGFGRSGGKRGHVPSFDVWLDDVEDNIAELRTSGQPVVLFGHSMGGLIAFCYAISERPQPDVLVLSGPAIGAEIPAWQRIAAPILGRLTPKLYIKSEFDGALLATDPDVGVAYIEDPLRVAGATAGLGRELMDAMRHANERIDRLTLPTLVMHGGGDRIVPKEHSAPIGAQSSAERTVLPGLEHEILNEPSWAETTTVMIDFANEQLAHQT